MERNAYDASRLRRVCDEECIQKSSQFAGEHRNLSAAFVLKKEKVAVAPGGIRALQLINQALKIMPRFPGIAPKSVRKHHRVFRTIC